MRSNMMFYQSELNRGSRGVLQWSKVLSKNVFERNFPQKRQQKNTSARYSNRGLPRWLGGTIEYLVALYGTVAVTFSLFACTIPGMTYHNIDCRLAVTLR